MASVLPRLILSSADGVDPASLRLDSPRHEPHRPSDLELCPLENSDDEDFFSLKSQDTCYNLKIPSPTYRIMFTPNFLIHPYGSEDEYSDERLSDLDDLDEKNDVVYARPVLPAWSSRVEHVKPLISRLIDEENSRRESVRLAWRWARPATPTDLSGSLSISLDLQNGVDSMGTQSSFWPSCTGRTMGPACESDAPLRRTKSLADLSTDRPPRSGNNFRPESHCSAGAYAYRTISKENEIKRWVSAVSVS